MRCRTIYRLVRLRKNREENNLREIHTSRYPLMASVPLAPAVTPADRLGLLLFLGALLHGLVILGISFAPPDPPDAAALPTLDIILVQTKSAKKPDEADYLAQANQDGGGTLDKKVRPSQPVIGKTPIPSKTQPQKTPQEAAARPVVKKQAREVVTSTKGGDIVLSRADKKVTKKPLKHKSARELIKRSLEIASLTQEISNKREQYAKRPRRKFINARTREFAPAAYMAAWVRKVERIGNLNYPDEARRQKLSGVLRLTVIIRKDGAVEQIIVERSSGHTVLDDAAIRIVKLGSPYAPIPDNIKEEGEPAKFLHITRTWEFLSSNTWRDRDS